MQDINQRKDLALLVSEFYKKVLADKEIAPVFTGKVKINWTVHLPIICDFWENLLWGGNKYQDDLMQKYLDFNKKIPLTLLHWNTTLTEKFSGKKAVEVKERSAIIGKLILFKISQ